MSKVQVIRDGRNRPLYAIVPWKDYVALAGEDDAAEHAGLIALAQKTRGEDGLPLEIVERTLQGENALKVLREWRGLTQKELAEKSGLAKLYVSQLETGRRKIGATAARKLAPALDVSVGTLLLESDELTVIEREPEAAEPALGGMIGTVGATIGLKKGARGPLFRVPKAPRPGSGAPMGLKGKTRGAPARRG